MTPEAREALEASIVAWEHKLTITQTGNSGEILKMRFSCLACPLCSYIGRNRADGIPCEVDCLAKCPVAFVTQSPYCIGTPYRKARDAWYEYDENPSKNTLYNLASAITDEVNFLKSLLPKD